MGINLRDIKTGSEPVPEGRYNVIVDKAELAVSEKGNQTINVTFKITDGDYEGKLLWDTFTLIQNSYWKLKAFLDATGSDLTKEDDIPEIEIAQRMKGLKVSVAATPALTNKGNPKTVLSNYTKITPVAGGKAKQSLFN